jgi:hypothetical protein
MPKRAKFRGYGVFYDAYFVAICLGHMPDPCSQYGQYPKAWLEGYRIDLNAPEQPWSVIGENDSSVFLHQHVYGFLPAKDLLIGFRVEEGDTSEVLVGFWEGRYAAKTSHRALSCIVSGKCQAQIPAKLVKKRPQIFRARQNISLSIKGVCDMELRRGGWHQLHQTHRPFIGARPGVPARFGFDDCFHQLRVNSLRPSSRFDVRFDSPLPTFSSLLPTRENDAVIAFPGSRSAP